MLHPSPPPPIYETTRNNFIWSSRLIHNFKIIPHEFCQPALLILGGNPLLQQMRQAPLIRKNNEFWMINTKAINSFS